MYSEGILYISTNNVTIHTLFVKYSHSVSLFSIILINCKKQNKNTSVCASQDYGWRTKFCAILTQANSQRVRSLFECGPAFAPFRGRSLYEGQCRKYREMSFLEKWWVEANIICPFNTFAKMKKLCPPQVPQYLIDKYLRYKRVA